MIAVVKTVIRLGTMKFWDMVSRHIKTSTLHLASAGCRVFFALGDAFEHHLIAERQISCRKCAIICYNIIDMIPKK